MDKRSYLSIDLDYWQKEKNDVACRVFFEKVFRLKLPILVVDSHERLLWHVNKSRADILYNVDYHSDFVGYKNKAEEEKDRKRKPKDGTWINYVKWRRNGEVHWMYPEAKCYGSCQMSAQRGSGACWVEPSENPFRKSTRFDWKSARRSLGNSDVQWDTVVAVGLSISSNYLPILWWGDNFHSDLNVLSYHWTLEQLGLVERVLNSLGTNTEGSKWEMIVQTDELPKPVASVSTEDDHKEIVHIGR